MSSTPNRFYFSRPSPPRSSLSHGAIPIHPAQRDQSPSPPLSPSDRFLVLPRNAISLPPFQPPPQQLSLPPSVRPFSSRNEGKSKSHSLPSASRPVTAEKHSWWSDTGAAPSPASKTRIRLTGWQQMHLEGIWLLTRTPPKTRREEAAQYTGMTPRQVQVWFQNRRQKEKKIAARTSEAGMTAELESESEEGQEREGGSTDSFEEEEEGGASPAMSSARGRTVSFDRRVDIPPYPQPSPLIRSDTPVRSPGHYPPTASHDQRPASSSHRPRPEWAEEQRPRHR